MFKKLVITLKDTSGGGTQYSLPESAEIMQAIDMYVEGASNRKGFSFVNDQGLKETIFFKCLCGYVIDEMEPADDVPYCGVICG